MTEAQAQEIRNANPGRTLVKLSSQSAAEVVARVPNMAEMGEMRARVRDKAKEGGAMEWLVRSCVVYPALQELNALLNSKPVLVEKWYQKLEQEAGASEEVEVSKF